MAGKVIITQLEGNAVIFAPDGSVRVAEQYAELKPEEVLVTESGSSAVLKENGEREIRLEGNSGFLFETPPDIDGDISNLQRAVEEGEDPSENGDPAAGQSSSTSSVFLAGDAFIIGADGAAQTLSELLEESQGEGEDNNIEQLTTNSLTSQQIGSLAALQRFFLDQLRQSSEEETVDTPSTASTPPPVSSSNEPEPTPEPTPETTPESPPSTDTATEPANDNVPTLTLSATEVTEEAVTEGMVVATFTASDADNNPLTFILTNDDGDYFELGDGEVLLTAAGVDAINNDSLNIESLDIFLTVSDGLYQASASDTLLVTRVNDNTPAITITTNDVSEANVVEGLVIATISIDDSDGDDVTLTLRNNDDGYLALDGNKVVLTAAGVSAILDDGLDINSLTVSVQASDGVNVNSASADLQVGDDNEVPPEISVSVQTLTEESVSDTTLVATVTTSDGDGDDVTLTLLNNDDGYLRLDGNDIYLTEAGVAAINADGIQAITELSISVQASDGKFNVTASDTVSVTRVNDNAPTLSVNVSDVMEESVSAGDVVATIASSDADGGTLTFSLAGENADWVEIVGNEVRLTQQGVDAINSDSAEALVTGLAFNVQVFDGVNTVSELVSVAVSRVDDIVTQNDNDVVATLGTASGNVISGLNGDGAGADVLVDPGSVSVTEVNYQGVDYLLTDGSVTIDTESGRLTLSANGDYSYVSSVQTEFYASELNAPYDSANGVTFLGSGLSNTIFLSGNAAVGLDLDEVHHPSEADPAPDAGPDVDDVIVGTNGADTLYGYAGDDTITAGNGVDVVHGGEGNDSIWGENGADELYGDAGADVLSGGNSEDHLYGGAGNDTLDGGRGDDRMVGGSGDDILTLDKGNDTVVFESGNDTVTDFNPENDVIIIKNATTIDSFAELVMTQQGADTVITLDTGTLTLKNVEASALTEAMFTFDATVSDIEYDAAVYGFNDEVDDVTFSISGLTVGTAVGWYLYDVSGNIVGNGTSTYDGSALRLTAPEGDNFRYVALDAAGLTVETVYAELTAATVADETFTYTLADSDNNAAQATLTISYDDDLRVVDDIATVQTAGLNDDNLDVHIAEGNLFSNDSLVGNWQFSSIQFEGATYSASEGVLLIETEHGSLTIYGEDDGAHQKGDFIYQLMTDAPADDVLESFTYELVNDSGLRLHSVLDIRIDDNNDADLSSLINNTELTGDEGDNLLVGRSGDDVLTGHEGADYLYGNAGIDVLDGGLGDDLLVGGKGNDVLTGGEGADIFTFLRGDANTLATDTLKDFDVTTDVLDLSDLLDGANNENIDDYLVSLVNDDGKATLTIASSGLESDQVIVFDNKSLDELSVDMLGISGGSGAEILGRMLEEGVLITHQV